MPSTWKQCTHIFINTLTWYYARSIFPRPINTNWEHNWWYLMLCRWYFSAFRWIWVYFGFACVPSRLRTDTPQGNIEMGTELTQDLLWNWTCVASALIDRWFHVGNFPAVCECLSLHDILESRIQLITWTQVLGLDILASIFNKDSNCTKPRYWSSKISDHLWRRYLPPVTLISNNKV